MKKLAIVLLITLLIVPFLARAQDSPSHVTPYVGYFKASSPGGQTNIISIYNKSGVLTLVDGFGSEYTIFSNDPNGTVSLPSGDYGAIISTDGTLTIDANSIGPDQMISVDHGAFTYTSGVAALDPNTVTGDQISPSSDVTVNTLHATNGITTDATANPGYYTLDSDANGTDPDDQKASYFWGNQTDTTEDAEISDTGIDAWISGSQGHVVEWDGSDEALILGDSASGEDLKFDFETITDNEVQISSNSGATDLKLVSLNILTNGTLAGRTESRILTNCEGAHDGDNNAAILTDSGESFTVDGYIGMTLYNLTDSSSGTITDNDGTTMTCTLSGGTDNDWDTGDTWAVAPGPYQSGFIWYVTSATTILHPATAYYFAGYFAAGAVVVKIDPQSDSMTINFSDDGVYTDPGAGDEIDGDGTQGDFIVIHNASATEAYSWGINGSWSDGGAT